MSSSSTACPTTVRPERATSGCGARRAAPVFSSPAPKTFCADHVRPTVGWMELKNGSLDGGMQKLTIRERIHLCREYAQEAQQLAQCRTRIEKPNTITSLRSGTKSRLNQTIRHRKISVPRWSSRWTPLTTRDLLEAHIFSVPLLPVR